MPQAWIDALNAAVTAGNIPNIPQSTESGGQNPVYPQGYDPTGPEVCSGTYKCMNPLDYWNAPSGYFGTGFDDGPTEVSFHFVQHKHKPHFRPYNFFQVSPMLYNFLQENNISATHFMIGIQILSFPSTFQFAFDTLGGDIAVHTWTHPYMTTLSNLDVVAQLGWTMQIIHDSTGGRLPQFWRPPYGDSDNRVRAIAQEVFGLKAIYWNQEYVVVVVVVVVLGRTNSELTLRSSTEDWSLTTPGGTTMQAINTSMTQWLTGVVGKRNVGSDHSNVPIF